MVATVCWLGAAAFAQEPASPPFDFHLGRLRLKPSGFLDIIGETRSATDADSVSTRFGSFPLNETPGESIASVAHSRVMIKGDLPAGAVRFTGYVESDFLNPVADSAPWRWRQYWASARIGGWEILGGQAWSLLRPNRQGVASDKQVMNTDAVEPAYHVGLAGSRRRQIRLVRQFGSQHLAVAWENNGNYVAKLTTDRDFGHLEVAGFSGRSSRRGASLAGVIGTGKIRFVTQQLWSKRDIAEALGLVPARVGGVSTIQGPEYHIHKRLQVYGYAGIVYGDRSLGNRVVNQYSTGFDYRFGLPSMRGWVMLSMQYSRLSRALWSGPSGSLDYVMYRLRYTFNN